MKVRMKSALLVSLTVLAGVAMAQSATDDIAKYREMIADGNPSELYEAAGEDLWKKVDFGLHQWGFNFCIVHVSISTCRRESIACPLFYWYGSS